PDDGSRLRPRAARAAARGCPCTLRPAPPSARKEDPMTKEPYVPLSVRELEGTEREEARALFAWRALARQLAAQLARADVAAETIDGMAVKMRDAARRL